MPITEKTLTDTLKNYRNIRQRMKEIENLGRVVSCVAPALFAGITIPRITPLHDSHVSKGPLSLSPEILDPIIEGESERRTEYKQLQAIVTLIEKMVISLDDDCRNVIECLYYKGNTYDRTSEILDISRATVTARRKRAIQNMLRMI